MQRVGTRTATGTDEIGASHMFESLESARAAFHAVGRDGTEGER